jgi:hypothetical protein
MPPLEWAPLAQALPGRLLVQRLEMPISRGRIILPESSRKNTRSGEAIIKSLGEGAAELVGHPLALGHQVLLSGLVGRPIKFGLREEVELLDVPASAVLAILPAELADEAVSAESHPMQHWDRGLEAPVDGWEEGDLRGTR